MSPAQRRTLVANVVAAVVIFGTMLWLGHLVLDAVPTP